MLRICLALLLTCASAHALAQNGRNGAHNPGACQETDAAAREEAQQTDASPSKASPARNKYAKPASSTAVGGGGGSDDSLPRARGSKWHSFLPGMFR